MDHSIDLSIPDLNFFFKGMDRSNEKILILYKSIIANTSAIWQHPAHTTDQLTSSSCKTGAIHTKKAYLLTKNVEEFSGKSSEE